MSDNFESKKNGFIQQMALSAISKLNLVTRQEFDTQTQVLVKTRLRLEQLEQKLMELQRQE
jgi:BMFP domain-containing protein YqiC